MASMPSSVKATLLSRRRSGWTGRRANRQHRRQPRALQRPAGARQAGEHPATNTPSSRLRAGRWSCSIRTSADWSHSGRPAGWHPSSYRAAQPWRRPGGVGGEWFAGSAAQPVLPYNGGLGREQRWLRAGLADATAAEERVCICATSSPSERAAAAWCGTTLGPKLCSPRAVVAAYSVGDHFGQYRLDEHGVHHCLLLAAQQGRRLAFELVRVWDDALEVCGGVDDLLPAAIGQAPGRPAKVALPGGECERHLKCGHA